MSLTYWSAPGMKSVRTFFTSAQILKIEGKAFNMIMRIVCKERKLDPQDLVGTSRKRDIAEGRHLVFYLLKQHTVLTLKQIGFPMGGRDHSTVIHACDSIKNRLDTEPLFRDLVERIESKIV